MVLIAENPIKMDDLGGKATIFRNIQLVGLDCGFLQEHKEEKDEETLGDLSLGLKKLRLGVRHTSHANRPENNRSVIRTRWFQTFFDFHPSLGKVPSLTKIFQNGGFNHHLEKIQGRFLNSQGSVG